MPLLSSPLVSFGDSETCLSPRLVPARTDLKPARLTRTALSTDLSPTRSGSGKSRIKNSEIYLHRQMGPADSAPRHICGGVTIVAAELDPLYRCRALARTGGRVAGGWCCRSLCCCPAVSLRKPQRNPVDGALRLLGDKTRPKHPKRTSRRLANLRAIQHMVGRSAVRVTRGFGWNQIAFGLYRYPPGRAIPRRATGVVRRN